jgi:hypothetical protein
LGRAGWIAAIIFFPALGSLAYVALWRDGAAAGIRNIVAGLAA